MTLYANRYKYLGMIGRGGFGHVMRVFDNKSKTVRAIKFLGEKRSAQMLHHEFSVLQSLRHPNLARVFDIGFLSEDEKHKIYIVSEFVEGIDLLSFSQNQPPHLLENLFVQMLHTLGYLHENGICHGDIKPENILVTWHKRQPLAKLIDFGFAQISQLHQKNDPSLAELQNVNLKHSDCIPKDKAIKKISGGTLAYMAPEVLRDRKITPQSDIYALGMVFHKILARHFDGKNPQSAHLVLSEFYRNIIGKMIDSNPSRRYQNTDQILHDTDLIFSDDSALSHQKTENVAYLNFSERFFLQDLARSRFEKIYRSRLFDRHHKNPAILWIHGEDGVGKTHFLHECCKMARDDLVPVLSWQDWQNIGSFDDLPKRALIFCDDAKPDEESLNYIQTFFAEHDILFVFAADKPNTFLQKNSHIELKRWDLAETKLYLKKAIGQNALPDSFVNLVFAKTMGLPLYLDRFLKTLFANNILRGKTGTWSAKVLDDLQNAFAKWQPEAFIVRHLQQKLKKSKLSQKHTTLLFVVSICQKITLPEIENYLGKLCNLKVVDELLQEGLLCHNENGFWQLSHPLLADVILHHIPKARQNKICRSIAKYLKTHSPDDENRFLFGAHSGINSSFSDLMFYVKLKRKTLDWSAAKNELCFALAQKNLPQKWQASLLLELADLHLEIGDFTEASQKAEKILHLPNISSHCKISAFEMLGVCSFRDGKPKQAILFYEKALKNLEKAKIPDKKPRLVSLQSRLARAFLEIGKIEQAEYLTQNAWLMWKNELSLAQKMATIRCNIDELYYQNGDYEKALACLKEHEALIPPNQNSESYGITLYKMARVHIKMQDFPLAERKLELCLAEFKKRNSSQWLSFVYNELGILYKKTGELTKALESFQHAFELQRQIKKDIPLFLIAKNLGGLHLQQGDWQEAKKFLSYALKNLAKNPENTLAEQAVKFCKLALNQIETQTLQNPPLQSMTPQTNQKSF